MKYPKPYFKNVPGIGSLDMDYVFYEAECPMLFTCVDKYDSLYLCVCCDIVTEQRWVIAPVSIQELIDVITNKKSLGNAFKKESLFVARWRRGYEEEIIEQHALDKVSSMDIPDEDDYLDAEDGEFDDYIIRLKDRLANKEIGYK